jgi:Uma2 family endonuclease
VIVPRRATLEDLYAAEGPAELVGGRIVRDMTGERLSEIAFNIAASLRAHVKQTGHGKVHPDGVGYAARVDATDRESFCPDASYHTHPRARDPMRFIVGAPDFAVEVRSEHDYGPAAERALAAKRADYFEAGTRVVWDVDPLAETITVYRAGDPDNPAVCSHGDTAEAEPAVPNWRLTVDEVFT